MKKFVAKALVVGMLFSGVNLGAVHQAEAGWLGDVLGSVIGSSVEKSSGGKIKVKKDLSQTDEMLFYALRNDDWDLAAQAIENGADVNAYKDGMGTPIAAVMQSTNNYEMIEWLIQNGADVDGWDDYTTNKKGSSHYYIFMCDVQYIPFWIDHGVDPNLTTKRGITPINQVMASTIDVTTYEKQFYALRYLVEHGADVNHKTPENYSDGGRVLYGNETPLMVAARHGYAEVLQYLLDHGANPNIRGREKNKQTALDIAMKYNQQECVKILLNYQ